MIDLFARNEYVETMVRSSGGLVERVEALPDAPGLLRLSSKRYAIKNPWLAGKCVELAVDAVTEALTNPDSAKMGFRWTGLRLELRTRGSELDVTCFTEVKKERAADA